MRAPVLPISRLTRLLGGVSKLSLVVMLADDVHPAALVTVTVYTMLMIADMLCVVAPVLHRYVLPVLAASTIVSQSVCANGYMAAGVCVPVSVSTVTTLDKASQPFISVT